MSRRRRAMKAKGYIQGLYDSKQLRKLDDESRDAAQKYQQSGAMFPLLLQAQQQTNAQNQAMNPMRRQALNLANASQQQKLAQNQAMNPLYQQALQNSIAAQQQNQNFQNQTRTPLLKKMQMENEILEEKLKMWRNGSNPGRGSVPGSGKGGGRSTATASSGTAYQGGNQVAAAKLVAEQREKEIKRMDENAIAAKFRSWGYDTDEMLRRDPNIFKNLAAGYQRGMSSGETGKSRNLISAADGYDSDASRAIEYANAAAQDAADKKTSMFGNELTPAMDALNEKWQTARKVRNGEVLEDETEDQVNARYSRQLRDAKTHTNALEQGFSSMFSGYSGKDQAHSKNLAKDNFLKDREAMTYFIQEYKKSGNAASALLKAQFRKSAARHSIGRKNAEQLYTFIMNDSNLRDEYIKTVRSHPDKAFTEALNAMQKAQQTQQTQQTQQAQQKQPKP